MKLGLYKADVQSKKQAWVEGTSLGQGTSFSLSLSDLWHTTGCTSPGTRGSNRQQVFKHEPQKSCSRVLSQRNPEMWGSEGFPVDQRKDSDISPLARAKLLCLWSPPWAPLLSFSEVSGKYYRMEFNHIIWAIKKKKREVLVICFSS